MSYLAVSETFYSIQGEGPTAGFPAVFLRLQGCDFRCSWCDTLEVWTKGQKYSFEELNELFKSKGYYDALSRGAHLVITGGNPVLQQRSIVLWAKEYLQPSTYIEVETQGSIGPNSGMVEIADQWNISPKLANSGVPDAIDFKILRHYRNLRSYFKFPVSSKADLPEIEEFARNLHIPKNKVFLMPICKTKDEHQKMGLLVAELCKETGYRFSPRLQLALWDRACGV